MSLNHRYTTVHGRAIDMVQRTFKACMVVAAAILSLMTVYWYSNIYDWYKTSSPASPPTPRSDRPHQLSHPASKRSDLWVDVNPNENTLVSNTTHTTRYTSASCGIYSTAGPYPQPYHNCTDCVSDNHCSTYWARFRLCGTFDCKLKFRNQNNNNIAFIIICGNS